MLFSDIRSQIYDCLNHAKLTSAPFSEMFHVILKVKLKNNLSWVYAPMSSTKACPQEEAFRSASAQEPLNPIFEAYGVFNYGVLPYISGVQAKVIVIKCNVIRVS